MNCQDITTLTRISDVRFDNPVFDAADWRVLSQLPHRFGLQVSGASFTDSSMSFLVPASRLDYVVLHDTNVGEHAVHEFQRRRPDVTVMIGYPGDATFREYPSISN